MTSDYHYTYFRVPKTEDLTRSAQRYRDLRLQALKLSPSSFAATYESEALFTEEYWKSRLSQQDRETFVCAARPAKSTASTGDDLEWVAQLTLLGPRTKEEFTLPAASGQPEPGPDEKEERWQLLGLYTLSSHRGRGIAKRLCAEAIKYLVGYRAEPKNVQVRLMVKWGMEATARLYQQLGFEEVGSCTLAEALIANGEGDLLPEGYEVQEKFCARGGHVMLQRFTRDRV
ncbi:GNAT family N-acetyltransferase [Aspergillus novofumigatus IBT 16806]|uniref:Putative GNAT family acetyltransferase n=1 Tax=Aspergillus novofumigatus (strain IBT 16806) TaxID=1392255 RepID=A0A2I1BXH3_ASPN1|nr:putative GNAT family acetyltransferase [Aspergillus novofumigatus IBT 16806]PKX90062.1 putative GNAT family acetyltransferase [Aspergillus novofumigatus IBT 16806]